MTEHKLTPDLGVIRRQDYFSIHFLGIQYTSPVWFVDLATLEPIVGGARPLLEQSREDYSQLRRGSYVTRPPVLRRKTSFL